MDTRLQVDMKAAFSATDVDLLRAVRKAYTEVGVKPAGAAAGGGNTSRIYVAGHGMGKRAATWAEAGERKEGEGRRACGRGM